MQLFDQFYQLHHGGTPLLIGNVWDAGSARVLQQAGFKAIATSSAAVAGTYGYEDGENMPFDLLLQTVKHINRQITIPLSVDIEGGYSSSVTGIIGNIERLYELGAVGINIEDSVKGGLLPADLFAQKILAIANHLAKKNMQLFINARTDAFLLKQSTALHDTITRAKLYEQAGASGLFVPFLTDATDIAEVVQSTRLPVNVFAAKQLPGFNQLGALGVKRISMGRAVYNKITGTLQQTLSAIQHDQSFSTLY